MATKKGKGAQAVMTPRQMEILRLIRDFRDNNGYSPTLQEIADVLGVSKVTVFEHIGILEQKKMVRREPNRARSLIVDPSLQLHSGPVKKLSEKARQSREEENDFGGGCYPMAGYIAAGRPIEAIQGVDLVDLRSMFETSSGTYVLKVRGDSMVDDHICDGDYVLVQSTQQAYDGQVVVAILEDGQATLKKLYRDKNCFRLEGANVDFKPIYTDKLDIKGVVIGVLRKFQSKSR